MPAVSASLRVRIDLGRLTELYRKNEILVILCSTGVMVSAGMNALAPVLPLFGRTFGVSTTLVGLLIASFGLARVLGDLPSGYLSDRFDTRLLLIGGPLIVGVSAILAGFATNFWELTAYRFFQGVGSACYNTAAMITVLGLSTTENRGRILGAYHTSLLIGSSLGPAIGGVLGEHVSLRAPFFVYAGMSFLISISIYFRIARAGASWANRKRPVPDKPKSAPAFLPSLKICFSNRNFRLVAVITFLLFLTRIGSRLTILPLFGAEELKLGPSQIGLALAWMGILNFSFLYPAGTLADRWGRKTLLVPSCLLMALGLLMFGFSYGFWSFMASATVLGIATGMSGPIPAVYAADVVPLNNYGMTMGLFRTFGDLGWMIGPVLLGFISDLGGYGLALQANALLLFLGITLFALRAKESITRKGTLKVPDM
ncbi:MAG: MFS transporter [Thermodesulfobacteriota bacterium]